MATLFATVYSCGVHKRNHKKRGKVNVARIATVHHSDGSTNNGWGKKLLQLTFYYEKLLLLCKEYDTIFMLEKRFCAF